MKPGLSGPTVPYVSGGLLTSWQPWRFAGASANLLASSDFDADTPFWPVYFSATLNFFVSIEETLTNGDKQKFTEQNHVFKGFLSHVSQLKTASKAGAGLHVYTDFILRERHPLHHRSSTLTKPMKISRQPFLWNGDLEEISFGTSLNFAPEGESPLRLFGLAFAWFEEVLRVMDQAVYARIRENPFENRDLWKALDIESYNRIETSDLDYHY
ncbi:hypothetical protein [Litoreibacter arenae]|uniref:hypothetical protein n=1 Tax=Litoreibacter arenae TaxID=491388 RepID=UPI0012B59409|nr:hypothetical protein [Litoreibacter arenae]